MITIAFVSMVLAIIAFIIYKDNQLKRDNADIPTAGQRLPYIGAMFDILMNKNRLFDRYVEDHAKNGKTMKYLLMGRHMVFITDPRDLKHVLQTNFNNYPKGPWFRSLLADFFGDGIFNSDGENWRVQRKEATTLFHFENLTSSVLSVFVERAQASLKIFEDHKRSGRAIDVQDIFMRYTMDSIAEVGFGYKINSLEGNTTTDGAADFVKAFDYVNELSNARFFMDPIWKILQHKRSEFHRQVRIMNDFVLKIINNRRKSVTEGTASPSHDLLGIFLRVQDSSEHFSDQYLLDVVKNFVIAGRDTTALCLSWTCYWISQNPHVEQKLIEELDRVFPDFDKSKKLADLITPEKVAELKYMKNVIDESLRLSPPVPSDGKWCLEEDELPSGFKVSAGTQISYPIYAIHRDPTLWNEPLKFNPDRWVTDKIVPYQFIAFNAGPRVCLGQNMAYIEVKVLLAALLLNYRLSLVKGHDTSYKVAITFFAKHGMMMNVEQ